MPTERVPAVGSMGLLDSGAGRNPTPKAQTFSLWVQKKILTMRASLHISNSMKASEVLKNAAGNSGLRKMSRDDAYRFVKYARYDAALSALDALNIRMALDALEWLLQTSRLDAARHVALRDLKGRKLAIAIDNVMQLADEPTVAAYAEKWKDEV